MQRLIVICGATASGKTNISLALSDFLDIEIISADSRQVYKMLDIGTAKPLPEELSKIRHYFIDFVNINESYNAGIYGNEAYLKVAKIFNRGKVPIIVGGSGLYIKSLCEGLFYENIENIENSQYLQSNIFQKVREELEAELEISGIDKLYSELEKVDLVSFNKYHDKNPRRILRALEYYRSTGIAFSKAHSEFAVNRSLQPMYFAIDFSREDLYARINQRVEKMWDMGLVSEVEKILSLGYSKELNSLNTVGYKETIKYIEKKYTQDVAISEIQKNTRHYAKRQLTWFRKIPNVKFIKPNKIISAIIKEY